MIILAAVLALSVEQTLTLGNAVQNPGPAMESRTTQTHETSIQKDSDLERAVTFGDSFTPRPRSGRVTCSIHAVGYRFTGPVGTTFRYGRRTFTIPWEGYVELLASPTVRSYTVDGKKVRLPQEGYLNRFGMRSVKLAEAPILAASR